MTRRDVMAAAGLVVVLASCGVVGSDYKPTDETFRKRLGTFISDRAIAVNPMYGNIDVDSVFGKYVVNAAASEVLAEVEARAMRAGWSLQDRSGTEGEFHKRTNEARPGYEIVRVICRGQQPITVYVARLQIDGVATASEAKNSVEGRWASREFWPRFERVATSR